MPHSHLASTVYAPPPKNVVNCNVLFLLLDLILPRTSKRLLKTAFANGVETRQRAAQVLTPVYEEDVLYPLESGDAARRMGLGPAQVRRGPQRV